MYNDMKSFFNQEQADDIVNVINDIIIECCKMIQSRGND